MTDFVCRVCGAEMDDAVYGAVGQLGPVPWISFGETGVIEQVSLPLTVVATCPNGHSAAYRYQPVEARGSESVELPPNAAAADPAKTIPGVSQPRDGENPRQQSNSRMVTKEEKADLDELRTVTTPEHSFKVLDDFGKWLFGGTAVVASVAAGLGAAGFDSPLHGPQKILFAIAVSAVALSLTIIIWSLRPRTTVTNRWSTPELKRDLNRTMTERGRDLRLAGYLFALGLLLAGLVPIIPDHFRGGHQPDGVTYEVKNGQVSAVAAFANVKPRSIVRASFRVARTSPIALPRASARADDAGGAAVNLDLAKPGSLRSVWVVRRWTPKSGDGPGQDVCLLAIPQGAAKPASAAAPKSSSRASQRAQPLPPALTALIHPC